MNRSLQWFSNLLAAHVAEKRKKEVLCFLGFCCINFIVFLTIFLFVAYLHFIRLFLFVFHNITNFTFYFDILFLLSVWFVLQYFVCMFVYWRHVFACFYIVLFACLHVLHVLLLLALHFTISFCIISVPNIAMFTTEGQTNYLLYNYIMKNNNFTYYKYTNIHFKYTHVCHG